MLLFACQLLAQTKPTVLEPAQPAKLEDSFRLMYNLKFSEAETQIKLWEAKHPNDPLGSIAEASALLFSEFDRLNVLQTEFFETDSKFESRKQLAPDSVVRTRFENALTRAEQQSQLLLARDANQNDALFSMALANGLRADYAALIERRDFAALGFTKKATDWAEKLLAIAPNYYDGYLATGLGKYIIGSKPAPLRWVLRLGGFKGSREDGMRELRITAEHGRFLGPFARLLLAVGHLRNKEKAEARRLLVALRDEFPANPLFAREVERINQSAD
jgi:hypothetical protein